MSFDMGNVVPFPGYEWAYEEPKPEVEAKLMSNRPCPFCGGKDLKTTKVYYGGAYVECVQCEASVPGDTVREAIDKWNIRYTDHDDTIDKLQDEVKRLQMDVQKGDYYEGLEEGYKLGNDDAIHAALELIIKKPEDVQLDEIVFVGHRPYVCEETMYYAIKSLLIEKKDND